MFYSHEVLTSRKYGVATVWLVATLGSKSSSKKINRKAILEVDVPKACKTIVDPAAPMALRLQGNLLYGVSRVYLQQCSYVLSDAQNVYNSMHLMLQAVQDAALDPEAGKARPELLLLPDDPSFLPEFAKPPSELLAELQLGPALPPLRVTGDSQSLTPFASQQDPSTPEGQIGGLILPTSSSVGPGEFRIQSDHGPGSVGGPTGIGDAELIDDPGFTFDENGEFVDLTEENVISGTPAGPAGAAMPDDAGASSRVRQEHEEGLRVGIQQLGDHMDLDFPILGDDVPEGEAFPTRPAEHQDQHPEVIESSSTVVAPNRRKQRTARTIPCDTTMELRNKDLSDWNANYLANMKEASKQKNQYRLTQLAKKNAEYWLWGSGIGGIAARMQGVNGPTPFDRFIGDNLFELFTGVSRKDGARSKRDLDSGIDEATQEESRRVRQKTDEPEGQIGRGHEDEAMFMPGGDDVELPREAPSALDDQQLFSAMPWNISASVRGSSAVPRSGRVGLVGSAAPPSSVNGPPGLRGSRMISASPLHGRGQPGGLDALQGSDDGEGDFGNLGGDDFGFAGPGISSDMPEAALAPSNARLQEALSAEAGNFLTFVAEAIDEKRDRAQQGLEPMSDLLQADAASSIDEVSFDELIPPADNSRVVASQALMMTLTLGTKGLLSVRQDAHFEDISMSLTQKAKIVQAEWPIQEENQDGFRDEELGQEEGGHFEEQFAPGRDESDGDAHGDEGSIYGD